MNLITAVLIKYLIISILLMILQLAGFAMSPTSLLNMDGITDSFLILFSKKEFYFVQILALILAVAPAVTATYCKLKPRLHFVTIVASVTIGVVVVAGSWGQNLSTGEFATIDSYLMFMTNPLLTALHAIHFSFVGTAMGLLALFIVVLTGSWYVWRSDRIVRKPTMRMAALFLFLVGVLANLSSIPGPKVGIKDRRGFHSGAFGQVMIVQDFLEQTYQKRTGPLTTLYCSWSNQRNLVKELQPHPLISADYNRITTPADWGAKHTPQRTPNVLFILVESLRSDVIYDNGEFQKIMPNLTEIARSGSLFTNHYATATHSNYSDIVPLSSQYPLRSQSTHVYPKKPTYPTPRVYDILKQFGYKTAIISSQNEEWGKMINYLQSPYLDHFFHSPNFSGDTYIPPNDIGFFSMTKNGKQSGKLDDFHTVNETIDWISKNPENPFFIYTNYQNSHFPYIVPEGFPRPFAPEPFDLEVGFNNIPDEQIDTVKRRYFDSLYYIDHQIGRLIQNLKDSGRFKNTLIVVSGDTGQAFNEHGFSGHANMLFDETLRTPLIISGPGIVHSINNERVSHLDIAPTILAQLGVPNYPGFQGINVFSEQAKDRLLYLTVQSPFARQYGLIYGNVKFFFDEITGSLYLFDLRGDPKETRNLAHHLPEFASDMKKLVDSWLLYQLQYYGNRRSQANLFPPQLTLRNHHVEEVQTVARNTSE